MKKLVNHEGSILLFLLVAITIMGLLAGVAGSTWKTITQRAKEEELLWRGNQYRKAIGAYYNAAKTGTQATLPQTLEQLIRDPRVVGTARYLRKLYLDPITGEDWVPIKDSTGRIQGVHSSSQLEPFKKANFTDENKDFSEKSTYAEWQFVYTPKRTKQTQVPINKTKSATSQGLSGEKSN